MAMKIFVARVRFYNWFRETVCSSAVDPMLTYFTDDIITYCRLTAARHTSITITQGRLTQASDQKCQRCVKTRKVQRRCRRQSISAA
jgi:hypothetical protein